MSQSRWYRGSRDVVVCQSGDGTDLCYRPVRSLGIGMVRGIASPMYECIRGHRFALTDAPGMLPLPPEAKRGELDTSGESQNSPVDGLASGESQNSPAQQTRLDRGYHDSRRVTIIPRERPVFGHRQ